MKRIVAYVVKSGKLYANGACMWRTDQRRAFFFRWDGKPDRKWAVRHAKHLWRKDLAVDGETPRVVAIVRFVRS